MVAASDPRMKKLVKKMRELREYVERTAEYVGSRFAEEARRIHYKEVEERGIYGETTAEDARALDGGRKSRSIRCRFCRKTRTRARVTERP